jgi:hypothetical protein
MYLYPISRTCSESVVADCVASLLPETHRLPNSLTTHLHTTWMNRAMADPCLFHATLFCASAHLDLLQGNPHSRITVFHQSCAMMALRERLKGGKISYETAATALTLVYYNVGSPLLDLCIFHCGCLCFLSLFLTSMHR